MADLIQIRTATDADIGAITAIYRHFVLTHTATFEIEPPDESEMQARMQRIRHQDLPCLVALHNEVVIGYCYVTPYRPRAAYRFTVEDSVYIAPDHHGKGVGRLLLMRLLEIVASLGYREVIAIIGDSNNRASINLHRKAGFVDVGILRNVGYKFDRWLDTAIMQFTVPK